MNAVFKNLQSQREQLPFRTVLYLRRNSAHCAVQFFFVTTQGSFHFIVRALSSRLFSLLQLCPYLVPAFFCLLVLIRFLLSGFSSLVALPTDATLFSFALLFYDCHACCSLLRFVPVVLVFCSALLIRFLIRSRFVVFESRLPFSLHTFRIAFSLFFYNKSAKQSVYTVL